MGVTNEAVSIMGNNCNFGGQDPVAADKTGKIQGAPSQTPSAVQGAPSQTPNAGGLSRTGTPANWDGNWGAAGEMSKGDELEWKKSAARMVFKDMDADSNGQLTHKEIKKYLQDPQNKDARNILAPPGTHWKDLFAKMNSDTRNAHIDVDEFVEYYISKYQ